MTVALFSGRRLEECAKHLALEFVTDLSVDQDDTNQLPAFGADGIERISELLELATDRQTHVAPHAIVIAACDVDGPMSPLCHHPPPRPGRRQVQPGEATASRSLEKGPLLDALRFPGSTGLADRLTLADFSNGHVPPGVVPADALHAVILHVDHAGAIGYF